MSSSVNRTTTLTYTTEGQVETITDPRGKTTTLDYNANGDLTSVTDPLSHATTFGYDAMGRRTTVTDALSHTTTTTYDARGRVTRITAHDNTHTDFAYDKSGRRTSVTDPLGRTTRYAYDAYGRLEAVVDPIGGTTRYGYDLMSHLTSLTDANGNTTSFEYDGHGRVDKVIYPGGAYETFTYDAGGRLATKVDRKSVTTTYSYDVLGRLTGKSYSDSTPSVTYTYSTGGQMATAANGTDTLTWTYDLAGQLVSEQSSKNSSTVAYTYDAAGNRLTLSLDGTLFVSYAYDDASRLTSITRGSNVFGFGYDNANRRTSMTYPNGVNTSYTYDNLDRLLSLAAVKDSTTVTSSTYTYDAAGNRLTKAHPEYTEAYGYDPLYRLTSADRTGIVQRQRWTYDAVGNRLSNQLNDSVIAAAYNNKNQLTATSPGGTLRWRGTLDEPGNVTFTSATVNGQPARMLAGNVFEADIAVTSGQNDVTLVAKDVSNNATTKVYRVSVSGTGTTYTYDANGNLSQKVDGADTWDYIWNAENELKEVKKNNSTVATFKYDPLGRRAEKAVGSTVAWTYDRGNILCQTTQGAAVKYIHGASIDEPLATDDGSALSLFHTDALGSITTVTNSSGTVGFARRYDAWGNLESDSTTAGYAFTGREHDPETGLAYYRARYYDPDTGRFMSEDPIRFLAGVNFFAYVEGSPTRWKDATGLRSNDAVEEMANIMELLLLTPDADTKEYGFMICRRRDGRLTYGPGVVSDAGEDQIAIPPCPPKTTPVASCHTHPNSRFPYPGFLGVEEGVEGNDLSSARAEAKKGIRNYVGSGGKIYMFVPPRGQKVCPCSK